MVAEAVGLQVALQFLVAVLALTAVGVAVVGSLRRDARTGPIRDYRPAVGPLLVDFALDDDPPRLQPTFRLIGEGREQTLRLARGEEGRGRFLERHIAQALQHRVLRQADRVLHGERLASLVKAGPGIARVGPHHDPQVGPQRSQSLHDARQILDHTQRRIGLAIEEHGEHYQVILGTGDDPHQVLILLVEAVVEGELLLAMRRIVEYIDVQRELRRRLIEGSHELLQEPRFQSQQIAGCDGVLQSRQRRLAGQVLRVGTPPCD